MSDRAIKPPEPFPWKNVMKFGFGVLRLSSVDFWSLSVRELEAAMCAHYGDNPSFLDRAWLEKAIQENPDTGIKPGTGNKEAAQ